MHTQPELQSRYSMGYKARYKWLPKGRMVFGFVVTFTVVALIIAPLIWMIRVSATPRHLLFVLPPSFHPANFTSDAYRLVLGLGRLQNYFQNTVTVAIGTVGTSIIAGTLAGYSFSRFSYPGRKVLMVFTLSAQMFPWALMLISLYIFFHSLGLLDTRTGLILSHTTFALPLTTWILKGYLDSVPIELEQSAFIDGCGRMRALWHVILPVSRPGIVAAAIYVFIFSWNDFLFGLTLTTRDVNRTLPPGLAQLFVAEQQTLWAEMMAAAVLTSLPVVLLFFVLQKFFVQGLTQGALKE